jgi:putative transposase
MLEPHHERISLRRQCALLGLSRSTAYYRVRPEKRDNLALKEVIDRQYTKTPFYGTARMTAQLCRAGWRVNVKRVRRLMREMGVSAVYPKPRLSLSNKAHPKYPYLLRGIEPDHPDQVWTSDITYIRLRGGFAYLTAVMDWASRYVLSWELSNTLDVAFCVEALDRALAISKPEIFNSDQGAQYTSDAFTGRLTKAHVKISMDGRGRVYDNIFVERLWRTVKYEEVYLHHYEDMDEAWAGLARYFAFYNRERLHQSLERQTPHEVYFGRQEAGGDSEIAAAVTTPLGLRPPSVATALQSASTLNHARSGLDNGE